MNASWRTNEGINTVIKTANISQALHRIGSSSNLGAKKKPERLPGLFI